MSDPLTALKYLVVFALPVIIHQHAKMIRWTNLILNFQSVDLPDNSTYDFIVVGCGSAGAVLANRLTAPPNGYSVLVLEAGGQPDWLGYFPALDVFISNNPDIDWMYKSSPQKDSCWACVNNEIALNRGKGLGGCTNLNFLIYNRGNPKGFDQWAEMVGDSGWSYKNLLPYFIKSEDYHGRYPNASLHGCGGELWVDKTYFAPALDYFLGAIQDHKLFLRDINLNQTQTFMRMEQTSKGGFRWGTFSSFLKPILTRPNIKVREYAHGNKLIFSPANPTRVIGVEYSLHGRKHRKIAFARKEVIVSAGALNSPKMLLLSGIGPKDDLKKLGIPLVKDLPVGENLQDHPTTMFPIIFNKSHTSAIFERDVIWDSFFQYRPPSRIGWLEGNNLLATGYISSPHNPDVHWPDVQTFMSYLGLTHLTSSIFGTLLNIRKKDFDQYLDGYLGQDGNIVLVTLMRPKSLGRVTLNGTDPFSDPIVDPVFYSDPLQEDIRGMVHGVRYMVDFYERSKSYQRIDAKLLPKPWPNCSHVPFKSDQYYECHARHFTFGLWHPSGTCKMGRVDDPTTVVDSRLRVLGIEGLRVIDASIMPIVTNGNTNAPVIVTAEYGADLIIQDWGGVTRTPASQRPCQSS